MARYRYRGRFISEADARRYRNLSGVRRYIKRVGKPSKPSKPPRRPVRIPAPLRPFRPLIPYRPAVPPTPPRKPALPPKPPRKPPRPPRPPIRPPRPPPRPPRLPKPLAVKAEKISKRFDKDLRLLGADLDDRERYKGTWRIKTVRLHLQRYANERELGLLSYAVSVFDSMYPREREELGIKHPKDLTPAHSPVQRISRYRKIGKKRAPRPVYNEIYEREILIPCGKKGASKRARKVTYDLLARHLRPCHIAFYAEAEIESRKGKPLGTVTFAPRTKL